MKYGKDKAALAGCLLYSLF